VLHLRPPPGLDWCDALGEFNERAGIGEFDGGLPRDAAERQAFLDTFGWEIRHAAG
jgi:hypothetical protein